MRLQWVKDGAPPPLRRPDLLELYVYGHPEPDGGTPYSCVGFVKRVKPFGDDLVWRAHVHEFPDDPYLQAITRVHFKSRVSAMRELRKRFNVAWIAATPEERNKIWDGYK